METELGCGVATHDEACLCDVIIRQPLPPLEECLKDGVGDMWFGREVCDLRGYSRPWTDAKMLDYFEDLEKFYDAFHYKKPEVDALSLKNIDEFKDDGQPLFSQWRWIRDTVEYVMGRFDNSLLEIVDQINITPQQLIDALTTGKGGDGWTREMVDLMDKSFMEHNINFAEVCRTNNLPLGVVRGMFKYWENRRKRSVGSTNPARDRMHWLCRNTDLPPREIVDIVHREHGVLYNNSSVSKHRLRVKKNNFHI